MLQKQENGGGANTSPLVSAPQPEGAATTQTQKRNSTIISGEGVL